MEVDAAQYAMISMEMSFTKSFLHVFENGKDYLDKPPFLFWVSAVSYLIFGISNFAYKLPSVLFAILGLYSTYKFSRLYYTKETSQLAALILGTTQALFLITNDVRTDTILMSSIIFFSMANGEISSIRTVQASLPFKHRYCSWNDDKRTFDISCIICSFWLTIFN